MKENYSVLPDSVEIYELNSGKFDVILRKNIEETTITILEPTESPPGEEPEFVEREEIIYKCDEVQFRYSGEQQISKELIEEDFDSWWEYGSKWTPSLEQSLKPTLEDRISACEESIIGLIDVMFNISEDDEDTDENLDPEFEE